MEKKRKRTNMCALLVHVDGKKWYSSKENHLRKKLDAGTITPEEMRQYADILVAHKTKESKPVKVVKVTKVTIKVEEKTMKVPVYYIKCWNKWISCTEMQYNMAPECARKIMYKTIKTW